MSKTKEKKYTKSVLLNLTSSQHTMLKQRAEKAGIPVSTYIRLQAIGNNNLAEYSINSTPSQTSLQEFWQKQELKPSQNLSQEEIDNLSYVS